MLYVVILRYILLGLDTYLTKLKAESSLNILNNVIKLFSLFFLLPVGRARRPWRLKWSGSWTSHQVLFHCRRKMGSPDQWLNRDVSEQQLRHGWPVSKAGWTKSFSGASSGTVAEPIVCSKFPPTLFLSRGWSDGRRFLCIPTMGCV